MSLVCNAESEVIANENACCVKITKELSPRMIRRIRDVQDRIARAHQRVVQGSAAPSTASAKPPSSASAPAPPPTSTSATAATAQHKKNLAELAQLRDELDDIVAGECILCGDLMIRTVDRPFVDPEKETLAIEAWET
ncbi:Vacuolar protein sorting-associated protein 18 like protein [Gonapodya sp. JEL0774]|nr:Vacuolar protein sorting-associated protein 18 like protein [Gonapodya sp. JEL0774]